MKRFCLIFLMILSIASVLMLASCSDEKESGKVESETGTVTGEEKKVVTYAEFGAVGDGVTDDSAAIRAAHNYANQNKLPVKAEEGATYYIGMLESTIRVTTDVDWTGATFIIDDSVIRYDDKAHRIIWVFNVFSSKSIAKPTLPEGLSLKAGATKIDMTFDRDCMILVKNSEKKIYLREGVNQNNGDDQQELLLVDKDGNISEETPVQYDYDKITSVSAYPIDDEPITLRGGTFITRVTDPLADNPDYKAEYYYFARGIRVQRSNVTVENITHKVENERWDTPKDGGVPYYGFFAFEVCNNSTLKNCTVQGRREFYFLNGNGSKNAMGSYDMNFTKTIGLKVIGVSQSNSITDPGHQHGVMASYFCRNITLDDCYIDRFDSHEGLYGATITNSTLGFNCFVIGGGPLYMENVVRLVGDCFLGYRNDYGSIFSGDITLKDCEWQGNGAIIGASWKAFNYGLPAHTGGDIVLDNLVCPDGTVLFKISNATVSSLTNKVNPLIPPKSITQINMYEDLPICSDSGLAKAFAAG